MIEKGLVLSDLFSSRTQCPPSATHGNTLNHLNEFVSFKVPAIGIFLDLPQSHLPTHMFQRFSNVFEMDMFALFQTNLL